MTNQYVELKDKHQKEFNEFPMAFAFSNQQYTEGMEKLGLRQTDTDKVYSIGSGGFIRRSDSEAFGEMLARHQRDMDEAIEADETGEGFVYQMFSYELANHEYGYTWELEDTLDALGLTEDEVNNNPKLLLGLKRAIKEVGSHE